jgi:hypothetical protein
VMNTGFLVNPPCLYANWMRSGEARNPSPFDFGD